MDGTALTGGWRGLKTLVFSHYLPRSAGVLGDLQAGASKTRSVIERFLRLEWSILPFTMLADLR